MLPQFLTTLRSFVIGLSTLAVTVSPLSVSVIPRANNQTGANIGVNTGTSRNWSGYIANGGVFSSISASWTVPAVKPGNRDGANATWVGIGGVDSSDLIQSGTQTINKGSSYIYTAWFETLPQRSQLLPIDINPGDSVTVGLTQSSPGEWLLNFKDNTTHQAYQMKIGYQSSLSSADWIEEAPSSTRGFVPLNNFGSVNITNAWTIKDGRRMNISQTNAQKINMVSFNGQQLTSTSNIGNDNSSFTISRTDSNTPQILPQNRVRVIEINQQNPQTYRYHRFPYRGRIFLRYF